MDPEIAKKLEEGLHEVSGREVDKITDERRLDELGLDSVSLAELVILLEDELDIVLENEDLLELETFGDLAKLIESRREAKAGS